MIAFLKALWRLVVALWRAKRALWIATRTLKRRDAAIAQHHEEKRDRIRNPQNYKLK